MSSSSINYPLLSIPAYYLFSIVPHIYAQSLLATSGYKINAADPKSSIAPERLKGKVPEAVLGKVQRAEAAQNNNYEQQALFAVAVLSSVFAQKLTAAGLVGGDEDVTGLKTFIAAFFAARSAYVISYIQIASPSKAPIRSAFYTVGAVLSFYQIYKAATLLG
ncbi:Putative membrane-associated, eicosanoid/glutathione metabolism (MAPEG) protein [Septoria linicola]|uniref:Membrane-associated, eicosanoid/glutathione metabolism (MAPEG) protein n=1 Tax=Septoria linicola TaxID=215465 RepID=A0A9Q9B013_9PEZI|nr:putative membrane-associated, eicosanoid/glutathione metabolism (MAPEG) protein [Septoria linicola]USW59182.1 Putative membrane-associated, eicosanoid/glutathione metabolism (MAPEG) protein [Septoria linicola]